MSSPFADSLPL